jgi:hypothetical protein
VAKELSAASIVLQATMNQNLHSEHDILRKFHGADSNEIKLFCFLFAMLIYLSVEIQDIFQQYCRDEFQPLGRNIVSHIVSEIFPICTPSGAHPRTVEWYSQTQYRAPMDASPASPASAENILRSGALYACLFQR